MSDFANTDTPLFIDDSEYLKQNQFVRLAERRIALKISRDAIDAEIKGLNIEMAVLLATAQVKTVRYCYGVDEQGRDIDYSMTYQAEKITPASIKVQKIGNKEGDE